MQRGGERAPPPCPGDIDLPALMTWLRQRLPDDAIVTNRRRAPTPPGASAYFPHYRLHTQLGPISGSMG